MKKLIGQAHQNVSQNPFSLSVGDLMAALLLIFILLLSSTLLLLREEYETGVNIAEDYLVIKQNIYQDLFNEFEKDLENWDAEIDQDELIFRFKEPDILFDIGSYTLKERFKSILFDFFPRYIEILYQDSYKNSIEELRIEGHTSGYWNMNTNEALSYIKNMQLSQDRTRAVLEFVLGECLTDNEKLTWTRDNLTANGLSSSKPIGDNNTAAGRSLNRRVEFRIRTNAEKQIDEILKNKVNGQN